MAGSAAIQARKVKLACVNLKGGVGKTTLAVNIGAWAAKKGIRTLLVDLDPQTNASFACLGVQGWESHAKDKGTVADLFGLRTTSMTGKPKSASKVTAKNIFGLSKLHLIPSHLDLFTMDLEVAGRNGRELILRRALASVEDEYDLIVYDCPPNLTIPTQNAVAACSHVVIPVSIDFLSALGIALLKDRVTRFCNDIDHSVEIAGIAITRVGRPANHRSSVISDLTTKFKGELFKSRIKERAAVDEFVSQKKAAVLGPASNEATADFVSLCTEILQKVKLI